MKKNVSIIITEISEDAFNVQIGSNGYTITKSKLKELMDSDGDFETLSRNMAIRLSLSNVDINDTAAVKNNLELTTFKF